MVFENSEYEVHALDLGDFLDIFRKFTSFIVLLLLRCRRLKVEAGNGAVAWMSKWRGLHPTGMLLDKIANEINLTVIKLGEITFGDSRIVS